MKLYDRLKSKEDLIEMKGTNLDNYEEVVEILKKREMVYVTLFEATAIFWVYYPLEIFCLTKFWDLFEN